MGGGDRLGLHGWKKREERDVSTLQWGNKRYGLTRVDIDGMVIHQCKKFGNVSIKRKRITRVSSKFAQLVKDRGGGGGELYLYTHAPVGFQKFSPENSKVNRSNAKCWSGYCFWRVRFARGWKHSCNFRPYSILITEGNRSRGHT